MLPAMYLKLEIVGDNFSEYIEIRFLNILGSLNKRYNSPPLVFIRVGLCTVTNIQCITQTYPIQSKYVK